MLLDKISYLMANNNNQIKTQNHFDKNTETFVGKRNKTNKKQIPEIILTIITLKKIVTDKKQKTRKQK